MKALIKTLSGLLILGTGIGMIAVEGGLDSLNKSNMTTGLQVLIGVGTLAAIAVALFGLARITAGLFACSCFFGQSSAIFTQRLNWFRLT